MLTRRNKAEPVVRRGFASTSSLRFVPFFRSVKNHNLSNYNFSGKVRGKVCACFVRVEKLWAGTGTGRIGTRHVTRVAHVARR